MKKNFIPNEELDRIHGFLIGSKLGDAAFVQKTPKHNVYITFKHSQNQYEYLLWKYQFLSSIIHANIKERNFTEGKKDTWQRQFYFSTVSLNELIKYKHLSITELIDELDETAFSIWILDDGNCYNNGWKISCGRFTDKEKQYAVNVIKSKFNIEAFSYEHPTKNTKGYIRINSNEYEKVIDIITRNVPSNLDIIQYKCYGGHGSTGTK